ncbi:MAG: DNA methyltransferase [Bacillota bacterium]
MPNVWFVGQRPRAQQFDDWYSGLEAEHEAKTPPDLAARICRTYFAPGDRILDPMCGSGVILVEAARAGLDAWGIELEDRYRRINTANANSARNRSGRDVWVYEGDVREQMRAWWQLRSFAGIVIDPPYGEIRQDGGRHRWGTRGALGNYSGEDRLKRRGRNPLNLGNLKYPDYLAQMQDVYRAGLDLAVPGGVMAVIVRNYRAKLEEVDLAGDTIRIARAAGWRFHQEIIAITSPVKLGDDGPEISPIVSATQRRNARVQTEREGIPQALYIYNNVLVFKKRR